ncbi:hypothetical protein GUJ93_ZPchr0008g13753 [Zizania palustris]|uniref:Uncharacterized protein n=1 Tax=Zizania palustris TaxID=103762 RepID=A0A8J5V4N2_ZIZPA|nr:hypothetical protein GUJ93_ZPchr0008g13753 [Zizania palustris]
MDTCHETLLNLGEESPLAPASPHSYPHPRSSRRRRAPSAPRPGMDESGAVGPKAPNGDPSGGRSVVVSSGEEDTLPVVLRSFVDGVCSPGAGGEPLLIRLKAASCESAPRLREASKNSARDLLEWTRRGSGLRAILVISVGTITLIALTGLLIFMFFLLVATTNAIVISVLMSLAAAGGFLAMFFVCLVTVYIGVVSVAVFVISATVVSAIVGVMIATGTSYPSLLLTLTIKSLEVLMLINKF